MTLHLRLPGEPLAAREARRAVTSWALARGLGPDVDDLELVTSELVANAASHGEGLVTLEVEDTGEVIRLRVTDAGAVEPQPRLAQPDDDSGRGLLIVAALSSNWGSSVSSSMTEVWAELRIGRS